MPLSRVLFLITCSNGKLRGGEPAYSDEAAFSKILPRQASDLLEARRRVRTLLVADEILRQGVPLRELPYNRKLAEGHDFGGKESAVYMPAAKRYHGRFYRELGPDALDLLTSSDHHTLILSGLWPRSGMCAVTAWIHSSGSKMRTVAPVRSRRDRPGRSTPAVTQETDFSRLPRLASASPARASPHQPHPRGRPLMVAWDGACRAEPSGGWECAGGHDPVPAYSIDDSRTSSYIARIGPEYALRLAPARRKLPHLPTAEFQDLQAHFDRLSAARHAELFRDVTSTPQWEERKRRIRREIERMLWHDLVWPSGPPPARITAPASRLCPGEHRPVRGARPRPVDSLSSENSSRDAGGRLDHERDSSTWSPGFKSLAG